MSGDGGDLDNSTKVEGATDNSEIGNVDDALKVHIDNNDEICCDDDGDDASNLRYEDIGPSTGGLARGTAVGGTFTTLYNVSGSGNFFGFLLNLENVDDWVLRLIIDGTDVFNGSSGLDLDDVKNNYDYEATNDAPLFHLGLGRIKNNVFRYEGRNGIPLRYSSSIEIKATGSGKKFEYGLAVRTI